MGNGIAHVAALAGHDVVLNDVSAERINAGLATINGNMARQVGKGLITEADRQAALKRIKATPELARPRRLRSRHRGGDRERADQGQDLRRVCPHLKPDAILATNTSSISITRLAAATDRPERFIGIHFMNPVPLMQLVELIRGIATDDETFEAAKALHRAASTRRSPSPRTSRPSSSTASCCR